MRASAALALRSRWLALGAGGCDASRRSEPATGAKARPPAQLQRGQAGVTPMAERVAVLGVLNKRNGIVRDVALQPGQSVRWKDAIVRLRACETTAPWEQEQLTGAFVQLDVQRPDEQLGAGLLGLGVQGIAVAQRRRASGLRRLAQELRNDISGRRRRARRRRRRAARRAPRIRAEARGAGAGELRRNRRRRRSPSRAPPTATRHKSSRGTLTAPKRGEMRRS